MLDYIHARAYGAN